MLHFVLRVADSVSEYDKAILLGDASDATRRRRAMVLTSAATMAEKDGSDYESER